jgi:hypothetical protein
VKTRFIEALVCKQGAQGTPVHDASGCIIFYDRLPDQHRSFKWSGACKNGYGSGPGTLSYYLSNGALFRNITASENLGILVGSYSKEQFISPEGKVYERGAFDLQGNQDGQIEYRFEDSLRVIILQMQYSHGTLVGPHPMVQSAFFTPAGVDKFNSFSQTATYNTYAQSPDASLRGDGTIVAHRAFRGIDSLTSTWVGPILNGNPGGPGVWTFTGFANMPRMELQARFYLNEYFVHSRLDSIEQGKRLLLHAISLDNDFADAYAVLAQFYGISRLTS